MSYLHAFQFQPGEKVYSERFGPGTVKAAMTANGKNFYNVTFTWSGKDQTVPESTLKAHEVSAPLKSFTETPQLLLLGRWDDTEIYQEVIIKVAA
jgi:hypothetical protein